LQIDWLTVLAQIINFIILIVLLKKFLYRPILQTMRLRQQNLADKQRKIEEIKRNAERLAEQYLTKEKELEVQRSKLLEKTKREVENQRIQMIGQLRQEINQKRLSWYADLAEEKNSTIKEIKALLGDRIVQLSRKVLVDLASTELERQIIHRFLEQFAHLPEEERKQLVNVVAGEGRVKVLSHFDVSEEDAMKIKEALSGLHPGLQVDFEKDPDIICGVVMETEGYSWPWSIDRYLEGLDELFVDAAAPMKMND